MADFLDSKTAQQKENKASGLDWEISYDEPDGIIFVKTRGVLNLKSATLMRDEALVIIRQRNCLRCVLDHRELESNILKTLEIYNLPKIYKEQGISFGFRMAVIVPANLTDNLRFYETICRNNGYLVSIFFDLEKALEWLKK